MRLNENITKSFKKSLTHLHKSLNLESKEIAEGVKLDDRIAYMAKASAYITLEDHKDNLRSAHPCRFINPCKRKILTKYKHKYSKTCPSKPVEEFGKCH